MLSKILTANKGEKMAIPDKNLKEIKDILDIIEKTNFNEVVIKKEGLYVKVVKKSNSPVQIPVQSNIAPAQIPATSPAEPPKEEKNKNLYTVESPMIGTFFRAPKPGAEPYVKIGDVVTKRQVVCVIQAMKLLNTIETEESGTVKKILLEDGETVECFTSLFIIEKTKGG